ncbi:BACON domain-containing protein [Ruminiclostridium herbifermentans]|uniref:BACON domain-containing protein n=1 Tax=Ruminiclostridium herbifermentans TaxID=2488810 RepID=A0A4U7JJK7_9FIRM|nr:BACON domain-containing carbohydrate-binding protein [Ruminiclostridium herbifermentans]QNU66216.1 BACON domain-containing protein [Ruminiclostridium herbifermentans]
MKKIFSSLIVVFILCMLFTSVSSAESSIRLSSSSLTFNWDQTSGYFYIYTNDPWLAVTSVSGWLRFEGQGYGGSKTGTGSSTLWFTMDKNTSTTSRTGLFIVYNTKTNETQTISITQKGIDSVLKLTNTIKTTYDFREQSVTLKFRSTESWKIKSDNSFVTFSKTSGSGSPNEQSVVIKIAKNNGFTDRKAKITLSSNMYNVSIDINITQTKIEEFYDINISGVIPGTYNAYWLQYQTNYFYVDFTSSVPWKFESSQIQASIKEGGPGTYHIKLIVPRYDLYGNPDYGYNGVFWGKEKGIPLVIYYHFDGYDPHIFDYEDYYNPTTGIPPSSDQWKQNDGI